MEWELITDIIVATALITLAVFAFIGLAQLIKRKSFKKVDRELLAMFAPLTLLVITYVVFEKFLILNTRPNGSGEPSFPSTHTMITATIFFCVALALPKYIKSKAACALLDVVMLALLVLMCFGRVLANMHWVSDVLGALGFSLIFAFVYWLLIRQKSPKKESKNA